MNLCPISSYGERMTETVGKEGVLGGEGHVYVRARNMVLRL